jgi:hypothetical protein
VASVYLLEKPEPNTDAYCYKPYLLAAIQISMQNTAIADEGVNRWVPCPLRGYIMGQGRSYEHHRISSGWRVGRFSSYQLCSAAGCPESTSPPQPRPLQTKRGKAQIRIYRMTTKFLQQLDSNSSFNRTGTLHLADKLSEH